MPDGTIVTNVPDDVFATTGPITARDIGRSAMQGMWLGWSDEVGAAVAAGMATLSGENFGEVYRDILNVERYDQKRFQEQHPMAAMTSEIGGALGTGGAFGATLKGAAASGALYGAGTAEGNTMKDAIGRAAVGAGVGFGSALALRGAGATIKAVRETRAGRFLRREAERAGKSVKDLVEDLRQMVGPRAVVDVFSDAGEKVANANMAGRSILEPFLESRQMGQQNRILGSLASLTKSTKDYWDNIFSLDEMRKADAKPLYDLAFKQDINWTPEINGLVKRLHSMKIAPDAWKFARNMAIAEGQDLPEKMPERLTLQQLDWFKRGIGDAIEGLPRGMQRAVGSLKRQLLEAVDGQNATYAQARASWAGPSSMIDAQQAGRNILKTDFELSAKEIEKLTTGERDAYIIGAVRAIRDKIMSTGEARNVVKGFKPLLRERLRPVFTDEGTYKKFIDVLDSEDTFAMVRGQVLGGSPTAKRLAGAEDLAAPVTFALEGRPVIAILETIRRIGSIAGRRKMSDSQAKELAEILISEPDSAKVARILRGQGWAKDEINAIIGAASMGGVSQTQ